MFYFLYYARILTPFITHDSLLLLHGSHQGFVELRFLQFVFEIGIWKHFFKPHTPPQRFIPALLASVYSTPEPGSHLCSTISSSKGGTVIHSRGPHFWSVPKGSGLHSWIFPHHESLHSFLFPLPHLTWVHPLAATPMFSQTLLLPLHNWPPTLQAKQVFQNANLAISLLSLNAAMVSHCS